MITIAIGPTIINVCESTAKCSIHNPTETFFDKILETVDKNNYICVVVYSNKLSLANKTAYYTGGTATDCESTFNGIEQTFE